LSYCCQRIGLNYGANPERFLENRTFFQTKREILEVKNGAGDLGRVTFSFYLIYSTSSPVTDDNLLIINFFEALGDILTSI